MATRVELEKEGAIKISYVGFSWTILFFGFFVPIFRGDFKWFLIMLVSEIVLGAPTVGIGAGLIHLVFSLIYNKIYTQNLLEAGYRPASERSEDILRSRDFII